MVDFSNTYDQSLYGTVAYGDLVVSNGDLVLTADTNPAGQNPVLQDILQRLRTFAGECFVNTSIGVPWYQQLLGQTVSVPLLDGVLQAVVLATPGVLQLTSWSSSADHARRVASITFSAVTSSGQVSYTATVGAQNGGGA